MVDRFLQLLYDRIPFSSFTRDQGKSGAVVPLAVREGDKEDWKKTLLGGHVGRGRYRENECSERWRALEKLVAPPTSKPRVVKGQLLVASRRDYFHRTCANENRVINKST